MSKLSDAEIPGYCEIHCRTDVALFAPETINRLLKLAGHPKDYVRSVNQWLSLGPDEIDPLVRLAKERMKGYAACQ